MTAALLLRLARARGRAAPAAGSPSSSPAWRSGWRRWWRWPGCRRASTPASAPRPGPSSPPTCRCDGRRPLPAELDALLAGMPVAGRTEVRELVTVVAMPPSRTASRVPACSSSSKAVDGGYPFYGELKLDPARPLDRAAGRPPARRRARAAGPPRRSRVGDRLRIGGEPFTRRRHGPRRARPHRHRLDRSARASSSPPKASRAPASIATRQPGQPPHADQASPTAPPRRGRQYASARQDRLRARCACASSRRLPRRDLPRGAAGLRRGVARVERFLGLVALLSLLVGGIGVAQTRARLAGRPDGRDRRPQVPRPARRARSRRSISARPRLLGARRQPRRARRRGRRPARRCPRSSRTSCRRR